MHNLLNGKWRIACDINNCGQELGWVASIPDDTKTVPVPGIVQQAFPNHQGVSWYWRTFTQNVLPSKNERAILRFGAVEYHATVWLNGISVGGHEGSETPFEMDVTDVLQAGENLLAVRVLKPGEEPIDGFILEEIPHRNQYVNSKFQPGMSMNIAGIIGKVELLIVPDVRIIDVFARPDCKTGEINVTVTVKNDSCEKITGDIKLTAGAASPTEGGHILKHVSQIAEINQGISTYEFTVKINQPHLWNLDNTYLYRITVHLNNHELSIRCGFRDFRVKDGFFYLNGKKIFLKSSHTGNHFPIGTIVPVDPDHMRRDLLMAKTAGFNCIRWIAGVALPEQLDFCDEIGLMVYEENYASWALYDCPNLIERYERSYNEMILRDRNHPSITIWGMINEMPEGATTRCSVAYLPKLRKLDPTRLVLQHSGRWDGDPKIGSVSNPGSGEWEPVWGVEGPDAPEVDKTLNWEPGGYLDRAGDAHFYSSFPMSEKYKHQLRTLGEGTRPVFLSECGIGSQFNAIEELRGFDRQGVPDDLFDRNYIRGMADKFNADWKRFNMDEVYPFPVDFFRDSYKRHSEQRRLLFDMIRANPQYCGYNLTGLLDHALTGEGLWSFWRRWKNDIAEVLEDGWSSLRWCLFVSPKHGYAENPIEIEAVLANEGVLKPGNYPVTFRIWGANSSMVWEKCTIINVPDTGDFALPVIKEQVQLDLPTGEYIFSADIENGGAPTGDRLQFRVTKPSDISQEKRTVYCWGLDENALTFLTKQGCTCIPYISNAAGGAQKVILIGDIPYSEVNQESWKALLREIEAGACAVILSANPFRKDGAMPGETPREALSEGAELPWGGLLIAHGVHDWLYHHDCVGKRHQIFKSLQSGGILDWNYWGAVVGHAWFDMPDSSCQVIAAGFGVGYCCPGGFNSGILIGRQQCGKGSVLFNSLQVLDFIGKHPAADQLLINMIANVVNFQGEKL